MGSVIAPVANTLETDLRKKKRRRTLARKQWLAVDAKKIINQLEEEGWNLVFSDGSAKHHPKIGWVAGYGCVWMGKWETRGYPHSSTAQTNNWAELQAVITILQYYSISKALMSGWSLLWTLNICKPPPPIINPPMVVALRIGLGCGGGVGYKWGGV